MAAAAMLPTTGPAIHAMLAGSPVATAESGVAVAGAEDCNSGAVNAAGAVIRPVTVIGTF